LTASEIEAQAVARADVIAPAPKHPPGVAGMTGLFAALLGVLTFCFVANLPVEAFPLATVAVAALGFAVPFFIVKRQDDAHTAAFARQRSELERAEVRRHGRMCQPCEGLGWVDRGGEAIECPTCLGRGRTLID
jgi:hypothetical protein